MREVEISSDDPYNIENAVQIVTDRYLNDQRPRSNYNNDTNNNNFNREQNFERRYNQNRGGGGYNQNNYSGFNRGGYDQQSRGRANYQYNPQQFGGDFNEGRAQHHFQNYSTNQNDENEWNEAPIPYTPYQQQNLQAPKVDDWDIGEMVKKNQNQPSVNVYVRSDSTMVTDSFREKKFRGGDDNYRPSSGSYKAEVEVQDDYEKDVPIDWEKVNAQADEARKVRWAKCPLLVKNFYEEHEMTKAMTQEEVDQFRSDNLKISVARVFEESADRHSMPKPITRFEYAFKQFPDLMEEIKKAGFDKPSPIQSQMWPILLSGEDCIGIAQTGKKNRENF